MSEKFSLNGQWSLRYRDRLGTDENTLPATVPGNVELDLQRAGLLPDDLFYGENILLAERYETYDWTYEREFDCPDVDGEYRLVFLGVDCVAEYFVNGEKIGASRNMLVEHAFPVKNLKKHNLLTVKISSTYLTVNGAELPMRSLCGNWGAGTAEPSVLRRPAHTYGWDIMPRAVSAGIWRDVYLEKIPTFAFKQVYLTTQKLCGDRAKLSLAYELAPTAVIRRDGGYRVRLSASCKGHEISYEAPCVFRAETLFFEVENPLVWNPVGWGDPNLYSARLELVKNGAVLCEHTFKFGVRTVKLDRTDTTDGTNGRFLFIVNGNPCYIRGTNWVPLSPYHSQDRERLPRALELLRESGYNMVRCWGGNVYEADEFYDFLDENGILCWQDFAFGCTFYPNDEAFAAEVREEAKKVIERLRHHACLAVWAGDNENDVMAVDRGINPEGNLLTRKILAQSVNDYDPYRDYLPSSPFISCKVASGEGEMPENHLWGNRDYYKCDYYANSTAHFISEIGSPACVSRESAEKFIPACELENLHSPSWVLHSSDQRNNDYRIGFIEKGVRNLVGSLPADFDTFTRISQLSSAEAFKFFLENCRAGKPVKHGLMTWNLLDGWPESTEATVDFFFTKKLAFDVVKRTNAPLVLVCKPNPNNCLEVIAVNDTLADKEVEYTVRDGDTGETLKSGKAKVPANGTLNLGAINGVYTERRLLLLSWLGEAEGNNHYITGAPTYTVEQLDRWYKIIETL